MCTASKRAEGIFSVAACVCVEACALSDGKNTIFRLLSDVQVAIYGFFTVYSKEIVIVCDGELFFFLKFKKNCRFFPAKRIQYNKLNSR